MEPINLILQKRNIEVLLQIQTSGCIKGFLVIKVPKSRIYYVSLHSDFTLMERIFAKSTLREFWEVHPDSELYLKTWYITALNSDWKTPNDVKQSFAKGSILKDSRIVFNIKGNAYRLVTKFNFEKQWIFIRFIGTHFEYDQVDANTI